MSAGSSGLSAFVIESILWVFCHALVTSV
jgi:hypothetical protein